MLLEGLAGDALAEASDGPKSTRERGLGDGGVAHHHHLIGSQLRDDDLPAVGGEAHLRDLGVDVGSQDLRRACHLEDGLRPLLVQPLAGRLAWKRELAQGITSRCLIGLY